MLDAALTYAKEQACTLAKECINVRLGDACVMIRKSVLESITELDQSELRIACELKEVKLISHLFKSLKDTELGKVPLATLHTVLGKSTKSQEG